jgi:hypothetical protein
MSAAAGGEGKTADTGSPGGLLKKIETIRLRKDGGVIETRDGVHYIKQEIFKPGAEFVETLNPEFKELIDSVVKNPGGTAGPERERRTGGPEAVDGGLL